MDEERGSGSIQEFGLAVWRLLCLFGAIRLFVVLLAAGIAYSVMGNTAGRIIGAVLLLGVGLWAWHAARDFAKPS